MEPRRLNADQQLVSDLADLIGAQLVLWSAVVHRADQLAAGGTLGTVAYGAALDEVGSARDDPRR